MELITPTVHDKILDELAIRPTVNAKILKKANRLFTGSMEGRITEVIQNARRAGASTVKPETRPEAASQVGRTPNSARAWAISSPPVRIDAEAQTSSTMDFGHSPWSSA